MITDKIVNEMRIKKTKNSRPITYETYYQLAVH